MTSFWRNNDVIITSWVQVEQAASLRSDWRFEMAGILQKALSNSLKNIFCILIQTLTEVCAHCCVLKHVRIDSCDGLVSSRRQATTWTNESSVHCCTHRFINPQFATSTVARPRIWYFHWSHNSERQHNFGHVYDHLFIVKVRGYTFQF